MTCPNFEPDKIVIENEIQILKDAIQRQKAYIEDLKSKIIREGIIKVSLEARLANRVEGHNV